VFCDIHSHERVHPGLRAPLAVTNEEGRYRIDDVPPGTYTVVVWNGAAPQAAGSPWCRPEETVELNFSLGSPAGEIAAGGVTASLTNRIFVASAALTVVSIGVAVLAVNAAVTAQAEKELARGLEESAAFVDEYRTTLFDHFSREARLVADLPKLKAAVDSDDPPTVQPLADDYGRQMGADLVVVTSRAGRVLARSGSAQPAEVSAAALDGLHEAAAGAAGTSFWAYPGGVLQVVSVPIWIDPARPEILGTLSVGWSLDPRVAERFKALTHSEIAFALGGRILVSTLARSADGTLAGLLATTGTQTVARRRRASASRALVRPSAGAARGRSDAHAFDPPLAHRAPAFLRPLHAARRDGGRRGARRRAVRWHRPHGRGNRSAPSRRRCANQRHRRP
jgi:hypothetical protein